MNAFAGRSVAAALALTGCAQTTHITTRPQGAQVYINGNEVCAQTPCAWDTQMGLPRRYHLQLRKPGFQEVDLYVDKELNILWWVLANAATYGTGAGLLTPFVYRMGETLSFDLAQRPGAPAEAPAPAPPAPAPAPPIPDPAPAAPAPVPPPPPATGAPPAAPTP